MIEQALVGAYFLVPLEKVRFAEGFDYAEAYCRALERGGQIGCYDEHQRFVPDEKLTNRYRRLIPHIASALRCNSRSDAYRRFKLAALEKGTLQVWLEWKVANKIETARLPLSLGRQVRDQVGLPTLNVDLNGPVYEVVVPDTVDTFLSRIELQCLEIDDVQQERCA